MITVKDANGNYVPVKEYDLIQSLVQPQVTILGMNIDVILEFKHQYELKGGKAEITVESVREVFNKE